MTTSSIQPRESGYRRIVGIALILIAIVSIGVNLAVPPTYNVDAQPPTDPQTASGAAAHTLGGVSSPMGLAISVVSGVMLLTGIALLLNQRIDMLAMFLLGADAVLKLFNGIAQYVAGATLASTLLIPIVFFIVDAVLIWYAFRAWNQHKGYVKDLN